MKTEPAEHRPACEPASEPREDQMNDAPPIRFDCVDHVNMFVRDLEESLRFYARLFGADPEIKEQGHTKNVRWAIIGVARRFYFCLYELKGKSFNPDALHINHVGFHVPDFDETVDRVRALGIPVEYNDEPVTWRNRSGATRSLYVKDPNGYILEFSERLGGGLDDAPRPGEPSRRGTR